MTPTRHPDAPMTCDWCTRVVPDGDGHYTASGHRVCDDCHDLPPNTCLTCLGERHVVLGADRGSGEEVYGLCDTCFGQGTTPVNDRDFTVAQAVVRAAVQRARLLYTRNRVEGVNLLTQDVLGTWGTFSGYTVEVSTGISFHGERTYGVSVRPDRPNLSRLCWTYTELRDHLIALNTPPTRKD